MISGVTTADRNVEGKMPSAKDMLARLEISSENTAGQDLISEVGTKSTDEVLGFRELISR